MPSKIPVMKRDESLDIMQCRANAFGTPGEDRDMELEVFNARIGEEYCKVVN